MGPYGPLRVPTGPCSTEGYPRVLKSTKKGQPLANFPSLQWSERPTSLSPGACGGSRGRAAVASSFGPSEEQGLHGVRFGLALHVGQVLYGNIGSGNRLDFTCIGPAVNLAARIEKLTGKLQRTISASDDFARQCGSEFVSVGKFDFAGFTTTRAVFGLEEEGEPDLLTPDGQIT
jgi:adenylate cyclase